MKKNILFIIFVLIVSSFCFAQERFFLPKAKSPQEVKLERQIRNEKEVIKNSGYLDSLNVYLALRKEDPSLCKTQNCQERVQDLLFYRYLAEGRCEKIKDELKSEFCDVLAKGRSCSEYSGWKKNFCEGLSQKKPYLLNRVFTDENFYKDIGERFSEVSQDKIQEILGIYWGFKHYSPVACEGFLQKKNTSLSKQLSCSIVFSSAPDVKIKEILKDLALFNISKKEANSNLCSSIKNSFIEDKCLDRGIKDLTDIW